MYIEDIINKCQIFNYPTKYVTVWEVIDYFFDSLLDDYNIRELSDGSKAITKISAADKIYEVQFIDFNKNHLNYSIRLIFTILSNNRCHVGAFNLKRIKEESCKDIPNKMESSEAIERLKSLEYVGDQEARHKMADEILLSLISQYAPQAEEIIDKFVTLDKWYC